MDTTLPDGNPERKAHLERLDEILERLPDVERAEVWRGITFNLAERRRGEG